ncbi:hypothetical protein EVAR_52752_1 [Eumeta japonica]|uniref:Uncharacterized protein n=1 Tax=Eumeta variegata TaxID=151549 RepID=A0A4C1XFM7_EUMVA|nr:hypothetical protein EVAR_52752_1 [Eumeta japonica]
MIQLEKLIISLKSPIATFVPHFNLFMPNGSIDSDGRKPLRELSDIGAQRYLRYHESILSYYYIRHGFGHRCRKDSAAVADRPRRSVCGRRVRRRTRCDVDGR